MLEAGWLEEVRDLMKLPDWKSLPAFSSLGYAELAAVIEGTLSLPEAIARIQKQTRNYAKRQGTFFRTQLPETQHGDAQKLTENALFGPSLGLTMGPAGNYLCPPIIGL
jgi:tRNA dimethylallyltransferase